MNTTELEQLLAESGIPFEGIDHPAVYTCEEAAQYLSGIDAAATKNLLLVDTSGARFFLVVVEEQHRIDFKELARRLEVRRLSFATDEQLLQLLQVRPGEVSPLALVHDRRNNVRLVVDSALWRSRRVQCHPLVNTRTLLIAPSDIERFLAKFQ